MSAKFFKVDKSWVINKIDMLSFFCNPFKNFTISIFVSTSKAVVTSSAIKKLQKKFKISILFITHDLSTLKDFADKIYVMYHGEIIDENHPYRKQLFQLSQDIWRRKQ